MTATGSVALRSRDGDDAAEDVTLPEIAERALGDAAQLLSAGTHYSLFAVPSRDRRSGESRFVLLDRQGGVTAAGRGRFIIGAGESVAEQLSLTLPELVRHIGPISVAPAVRIVRGPRVIDLSALSKADEILNAATAECALATDEGLSP